MQSVFSVLAAELFIRVPLMDPRIPNAVHEHMSHDRDQRREQASERNKQTQKESR